mgnify:CR=1 FL=1
MNDWEKAVFMLDEGFTATELKSLNPSDAEAWIRLKPLVVKRYKSSVNKSCSIDNVKGIHKNTKIKIKNKIHKTKQGKMELMIKAFDKCTSDSKGWYRISDVIKVHDKYSTVYKHIKDLEMKTKQGYVLRPKNRHYHVWCCECRDKTMKPLGQPIKDGCGKWSIYASKHRYDEVNLLPKCEFCNRKKRLNKSTSKVYIFDTRNDALIHREKLPSVEVTA